MWGKEDQVGAWDVAEGNTWAGGLYKTGVGTSSSGAFVGCGQW